MSIYAELFGKCKQAQAGTHAMLMSSAQDIIFILDKQVAIAPQELVMPAWILQTGQQCLLCACSSQ